MLMTLAQAGQTLQAAVLGLILLLTLAAVGLLLVLLRRTGGGELQAVQRRLEAFEAGQQRLERALREELAESRRELASQAGQQRQELARSLKESADSLLKTLATLSDLQKQQLDSFAGQLGRLTASHEQKADALRGAVERQLAALQADNAQKLEAMRRTVDEKLTGTLERRLGESFRQVSERLEQVHQGLGEMQSLASGVGDLKRVLTNVKTRGTWGEIQLGNLLEQVLAPDQFEKNVAVRPQRGERVEYAIRLPGRDGQAGTVVYLPIDAKFPQEDYQRLVEAQERADAPAVEAAGKALEQRVRACAQEICAKYLHPPHTTDFAIMFLPTEGLYAEVVRRTGLVELVQRDCRVVLAGPTTLAALLNSLQMGFRTLAIQQRSSEVWEVLGAVKSEFGQFGAVIAKVQKKLQEASNVVDKAAVRNRAIQRTLRQVEELPVGDAQRLLALDGLDPLDPPNS